MSFARRSSSVFLQNSPRKLPNRPLPDDGTLDLEVKARLAEVSDHTAKDQGKHGEADQARQGGV
jgi:hypothetical protein